MMILRIGLYYSDLKCGGVQRVVAFQACIFSKMGYSVTVFLDSYDTASFFELPKTVRVVSLWRSTYSRSGQCSRIESLREVLKKDHIDIFYSHFSNSQNLEYDIKLIKDELGIPFLLHRHTMFNSELFSMSPKARSAFKLASRIHRLADVVLTVNSVDAAYEALNGANAVYVPNPVCCDAHDRCIDDNNGRKNVLWVGRFSREKRPCDAVRIFEKVLNEVPDSRLIMIGGGHPAFEAEVKAEIKKRGCSGSVILKPPSFLMSEEYENAAVCIITSLTESFSLVAVEAMSYGIPVISYALPSIEAFRDNPTVIQVPQGDVELMAKHVVSMLERGTTYKDRVDIKQSVSAILNFDHQTFWRNLFHNIECGRLNCLNKPIEESTYKLLSEEYQRTVISLSDNDIEQSLFHRSIIGRLYLCVRENGCRYTLLHVIGKLCRAIGIHTRL
jgi:glycosyltransferase involved in cell wall biosynthesis